MSHIDLLPEVWRNLYYKLVNRKSEIVKEVRLILEMMLVLEDMSSKIYRTEELQDEIISCQKKIFELDPDHKYIDTEELS